MKEKDVKIELFFDKTVNLYCAQYRENTGFIVGDPQYAPSKTLALSWLNEYGPPILELYPKKKQNRE